jgi:hypothetical protein
VIYLKGSLLGLLMFCYAAIFIPREHWQLLAKTQATIDIETRALINASKSGNIDQINTLLRSGADVNVANASGITPLIAASASLQRNAVELLLARGADRSAKTNEGFTAYDFAKNQLKDDLAGILASK